MAEREWEHSRKKKMEQTKGENNERCWCSETKKHLRDEESEKVTKDPDWDVLIKEAAIVDCLKQDFKGTKFRWWSVIKRDIYLEDVILHFVENCCYSEGAGLGAVK